MKTQIIHLEPFDDIISARDKINWSKAGRLLLVWPENAVILHRRLDLVLLQRQCQFMGTQLLLVTKLAEIHEYADELNIPYYPDLKRAQNAHWRVPRRFRHEQAQPVSTPEARPRRVELTPPKRTKTTLPLAARLFLFALGVLSVLTLAAGIVPGAQLVLTPRIDVQEITFPVQADPDLTTYNLSGVVPARPMTVIVEGRDTQPTSGMARFPDLTARGQVVFTNLTDKPVSVPSGTVVRSKGSVEYRFSVLNSGTVPVSATLTLPVQAMLPGPAGNQPANRLVSIEGILGTQLGVTNPQALHGGSERQSPVPTSQDRQVLQQRLTDALYASALAELVATRASEDILLDSTLQLSRILDQTFEPEEATPADLLSLNLRLEFTAFIVKGTDLNGLAEAVLNTNLPSGFTPLPGTLDLQNSMQDGMAGDETMWELTARRAIQPRLDEIEAVRIVLGLTPDIAGQRLREILPLAGTPQITLSPAWWPRLPILPLRVQVLQGEAQQP